MKTYDVGQNAGHLSQTPDVAELCEGVRICVVLVGYDTDQHPINHDVLLRELEMYSDVTGMKILHVDTTNTGRWYQHTNGEVVVLGENNIGFTCNDQELSDKFEAWSNDKSYEDVLSCQVVDWLEEMSKEETLNESMSVAFPAEIHDEVQDSQPPMDALLGGEDQALADPVEVAIGEEMDLDTLDIPGLPLKEAERRKAWRECVSESEDFTGSLVTCQQRS